MTDISPEAVERLAVSIAPFASHDMDVTVTRDHAEKAAATLRALSARVAELEAKLAKAEHVRIEHIRTVKGAQKRARTARNDALREAAKRIDRKIKAVQPEMTRRAQRLAEGKRPGFQYAIHRADLDARISDRDMILALIKGDDR